MEPYQFIGLFTYVSGMLVGRYLTPHWWAIPLYAVAFILGSLAVS